MEEIIFIVTHSIMAACCIWIIVVGMNFRRSENVLIIDNDPKPTKDKVAEIFNEKASDIPLKDLAEVGRLQLIHGIK